MLKPVLSLAILATVSLALAACASNPGPVDFGRPFRPMTGPAPEFLHNVLIANAPYPHDAYPNYEEEPTRFIFRPRNVIYDETDDGTGGTDEAMDYGDYGDFGGFDAGGGE
jgi:hypothetical protein